MNKLWMILTLIVLINTSASASGTRIIDAQQINNAGSTVTIPAATDTLVGRATTDTLTNKTLTAPAISSPTGIVKGDVGLGNVDNTSDATKNAASVTLTNKTISGSANTISNIAAGTSLTGEVPVANGGTGLATLTSGSVIIGAGTSTPTFVAPGSNGNVLTVSGGVWTSAAAAGTAPGLSGTVGSPTLVTAVGGVVFSGSAYQNLYFLSGNSGPVTITANPKISAGSSVGQELVLVGGADAITINDGTGVSLNGNIVLASGNVLSLYWDGTNWQEASRR